MLIVKHKIARPFLLRGLLCATSMLYYVMQ